jgi:acyl carrier protein
MLNPLTKRHSREIEDWIVAWVAGESRVDRSAVDVSEPFVNLGLSSRQAVLLSADLEDWMGCTLPASLVWDHPTIAKLARHLAGEE